jgi:hypothetical protein
VAERDAAGKKVHYTRTDRGTAGYKPTWEQEQSVEGFRKLLLRRHLLRWLRGVDGAFYVPFIGDGDIASKLYRRRPIYGADLDPQRVQTVRRRLQGATVIEADCDSWPFPNVETPFVLADFDAFSAPYTSFRSFWKEAPKGQRLVCVFTDGHRQGLNRTGWWNHPDGRKIRLGHEGGPRMGDREKKLPIFGSYLSKHIWPWFDMQIERAGYRQLDRFRYQRDMMIYWGFAIERRPAS